MTERLPTEALRQEEGIDMALDAMRRARASDEVREMIELRMKAKRDEATRLERALQEGLQQGLQQGERKALLATARKLLERGMTPEEVTQVTGLLPEDLET